MTARPSSGVTIRVADPADMIAIRGIEGLSASSMALLDHDLAAADRCCLVAVTEADGEVVGYAAAIVQLGEAQVIDLVVAPPARGRGIGQRLLDALLAEAAARGAGPVTLEVGTDNDPAQALYRRRGFVVEGRRPRYYPDGSDALIMWLRPAEARQAEADPAPDATAPDATPPDDVPDTPRGDAPRSNAPGAMVAATSTSLSARWDAEPTLEREDD